MPTLLRRIFFLYNLLNTILLHLVPKKLRAYLPPSWYPQQQTNLVDTKTTTTTTTPLLLPSSPPPTTTTTTSPSPMDSSGLRHVFQMFDANGDGRITKKELRGSLENMGIFTSDADLTQMIERIDANGDGCVDMDEFGALYRSIMDGRAGDDEEAGMKEAFDVFDRNGDGFITVDELRSVLASLGVKQGRTVEDCKRMIMNVDADGDGMVNYNEFMQMMRSGGFAAMG